MMRSTLLLPLLTLVVAALISCGSAPQTAAVDPGLAREIQAIRAIDNHAHPVRVAAAGEQPDREFDALPVDNMEPQSDPVNLRPGAAPMVEAWRAMWSYGFADFAPDHLRQGAVQKQQVLKEQGANYPAEVLDKMGVEIMLANRVAMGSSIQPPRFRWVPYADALMFPLDNSALAGKNPDRKQFFPLEEKLRARYLENAGLAAMPATLEDYLARVVTPTLERQRQGGAVAEKFEAAYLRTLEFDAVDRAAASRVYAQFVKKGVPADEPYKKLQDFLFRYIAAECGRLGMAVHIHTMAGAGGYFDVGGASPLMLESVLNDPTLRKTKFVMVHGGWPFIREIGALMQKPNAYLDCSGQSLLVSPATLAGNLREWLEVNPEKVLFGTDAYPYIPEMGWEESGWIAAHNARAALGMALTAMVRDGAVTRARASELAKMVLRENARGLYGL
jgi:predicted TIM-barrel fold metal-dependent hydrolase